MFWPDRGSGVPEEPARRPVASAVRQFFTEGGVGQPPTIPGADWFNQITNELLNLLAAAGIAPDKATDNQVLAAINWLISAAVPDADQILKKGSVLDPGTVAPGTEVTRGFEHAYYPTKAGALRVGGSDLLPLNDERDYWRGLPSQNAWGDQDNIGLYSVAFNRNGASYGTYSATFGHDCVAYGTASIAGGAGSCTGNPDTPADPFTGYCSFSWGKNCLASGQKSVSLGEEGLATTRASSTIGYSNKAYPSAITPDPVGAISHGNNTTANGQAAAIGKDVVGNDGMAVGYGANAGSPMVVEQGEIGIGFNTVKPAIRHKGAGANRGQLGVNNNRVLEHEVDIDLGDGQILGVTADSFGSAKLSLRGVNNAGLSHPIAEFTWTNPSGGSAGGELVLRMNGRATNALRIAADGSVQMTELKTAANVSGSPAGTIYNDGGTLKIV